MTVETHQIRVTDEQAANIRALIAMRNKTTAEIAAIYPAVENGTRLIRIDFAVERCLTDRETLNVRCDLVRDAIMPAAKALHLRLQCGAIDTNVQVAA